MITYQYISHWYEAYKVIAGSLHEIYVQYGESTAKEIYQDLKGTKFADLNRKRLFNEQQFSDITEKGLDPIQIFASFNYPRITTNRIDIINSLLEYFESEKRVDYYTSFEGCPSPIITQIIRFRELPVQSEIWEMFSEVMAKGIKGLQEKHFRSLKRWKGIDIPSFTMFLFWINTDQFLPLDMNTVAFLKTYDLIDGRPRTYKEYIELCTVKIVVKDGKYASESIFRNIVKDAYEYFTDNDSKISESTLSIINNNESYLFDENEDIQTIVTRKQRERIKEFKIIALRIKAKGETEKQKHLKNLTEGELYQFYNAYHFDEKDDHKIIYKPNEDVDLYSLENLNISISAIVGKNGSGKSTLAEFLYLIINKIAFAKKIMSTEKLVDEEVYADLFIQLDKLYKISVGDSVEIFEYELRDNHTYHQVMKKKEGRSAFEKFDIESFCYSIVVNYSLYAFNTNITGNWVYPLFHKNDSYQVPMVLNPLRTKGNINVNNEEDLSKSRMLSNILEPELIDFEKNKVSELVENSIPIRLILEFDLEKFKRKKENFKEDYGPLYQRQVNMVIKALNIEDVDIENAKLIKEYIYLKTVTIADRYPKFKDFKNLPHWISGNAKKLDEYVLKLNDETSHITFKLRQAINYLKHQIYTPGDDNKILVLSEKIKLLKEKEDARTIDLTPPAFFKTNVIFQHGGSFNDLSSGEKQQVFSINTIAYHIFNIASVMYEEDTFKYHNINIIFDEVELYFHPEMQRTYINNLRNRIKTLQLENNVHNINIIFITHSPFILSDIPATNILRLDIHPETKRAVPVINNEQSFGANIHDLLANDFFLKKGFMGEFANEKILEVLRKLDSWNNKASKKEDKDYLYRIIQLIGEPLVKESLMDLYREKIGLHESEYTLSEIDEEIKKLEELKKRLE